MNRDTLEARIVSAFENVEYPGDGRLRGSDLGDEPYLLEADFKGKVDRYGLPAAFLDQAPDGFATALSFFSDEALHCCLPAYLLADLDGGLESVTPVFHLTQALESYWYDRAG